MLGAIRVVLGLVPDELHAASVVHWRSSKCGVRSCADPSETLEVLPSQGDPGKLNFLVGVTCLHSLAFLIGYGIFPALPR
jgi:hypothetical protein